MKRVLRHLAARGVLASLIQRNRSLTRQAVAVSKP